MKTILFQGDSITDCIRYRENDDYMGSGYVTMTAGKIGIAHPMQYKCLNRGIGGDRSCDLYARIKTDIISLKPDILTILIGVNDTWHELERQSGISVERYETFLDLLICDIKAALPDIKIVLLEPFVLREHCIERYYDAFAEDVAKRQTVCRQIAEKYDLTFVPLQEKLEAFARKTSNGYVLLDGVHPSYTGHALIAEALYDALVPLL